MAILKEKLLKIILKEIRRKSKIKTIEEAIEYVKNNINEIPLGTEPEYIDGTYKIDDGKDGEKSIEETVKYLRKYWNLSGGIDGEEI